MKLSYIVNKAALFIMAVFFFTLGKGVYELLVEKISFDVFMKMSITMICVIAISFLVAFFSSPEAIRILKTMPKIYKKELDKRKRHS